MPHPGELIVRTTHRTTHPWPDDCSLQGGSKGAVLGPKGYVAAFVEVVPTHPRTFIRGEGATVAEAEDAAWAKYVAVTAHDHEHEYETRGYRNGAGICKHCGLFTSGVFDLAEIGSVCAVCSTGTYWTQVAGKLYCQQHAPRSRDMLAAMEVDLAAGRPVHRLELLILRARVEIEDDA